MDSRKGLRVWTLVEVASGCQQNHGLPLLVHLHNVTLLKDFCNSSLMNSFLIYIYTCQTSLRLSLPPPSHSSAPFVRLCWPYKWQYRLRHQCIGTKSWGEWWGKGEEIWDKTRWIERRRESESVLPRACQLFYYCDVWAFITTPANKKIS